MIFSNMSDPLEKIKNHLHENFSSTWKLLNDTNYFLSRTHLFKTYEKKLRNWRSELKKSQQFPEEVKIIRKEIISLRKHLRETGYDLLIGSMDLEIQGFRSDDSLRFNFSRAVMKITEDEKIYILTGQANHIELSELLEQQLSRRQIVSIGITHSLWYRWENRRLVLSGSDSESKEHFEKLKEQQSKLQFSILKAFKGK